MDKTAEARIKRGMFTPEERCAYEIGYEHGESSGYADWIFQFSEEFEGLDDVEGPSDTIRQLRKLGPTMPPEMPEACDRALYERCGRIMDRTEDRAAVYIAIREALMNGNP